MLTIEDVVALLERSAGHQVFFLDGSRAERNPEDGGWRLILKDYLLWPEDDDHVPTLREALEEAKRRTVEGL